MASPIATSGIYIIICSANKRFYIGSSSDIARRWKQHHSYLNGNNHHNQHLQNAWNKYGEQAFEFSILQFVSESKLEESEQRYLELFQPFDPRGFNIERVVQGLSKGIKFTDEHRANMSASFKNRPPFSEDHRRNLSNSLKGKTKIFTQEHCDNISKGSMGMSKSPEHKEKIAEKKRKEYIVISPDGTKTAIKGMRKFCALHDINNAAMIRVAQGKQRLHKGWDCYYV